MSKFMHAITIGMSLGALIISIRSCQISEEMPVKIAAYQARSNALQIFGEGVQKFDNFLRRPHLASVFGGPPAEQIKNASAKEFEGFSARAQEALVEYEDYTTAVNKSREPWPQHIQTSIMHAGSDAREAVGCYLLFQNWANRDVMPPLEDRKHDALIACKPNERARRNFEAASNDSVRQMNSFVRAALRN